MLRAFLPALLPRQSGQWAAGAAGSQAIPPLVPDVEMVVVRLPGTAMVASRFRVPPRAARRDQVWAHDDDARSARLVERGRGRLIHIRGVYRVGRRGRDLLPAQSGLGGTCCPRNPAGKA